MNSDLDDFNKIYALFMKSKDWDNNDIEFFNKEKQKIHDSLMTLSIKTNLFSEDFVSFCVEWLHIYLCDFLAEDDAGEYITRGLKTSRKSLKNKIKKVK